MKWFLALALALALVLMVYSQSTNATPSTISWVSAEQLQGQFLQEKHIAVLAQPFVTEGHYHYKKSEGLTWRTESPVFSEIKISSKGVSEKQSDGTFKSLTTDSHLSELLLALFSGEQTALLQQFQIEQLEHSVLLTPKVKQIASVFQKISLKLNDGVINEVVLFEQEGNHTKLLLNNYKLTQAKE